MQSISQSRKRFASRVVGAAGLLLFVSAFFAAPLANAWMLCAMSCCHHNVAKIAATEGMPCGTTECTISAPDVTIPAASSVSQSSPSAAIINIDVRVVDAVATAHVELQPDTSPHGASAPIHVLNSVFRI